MEPATARIGLCTLALACGCAAEALPSPGPPPTDTGPARGGTLRIAIVDDVRSLDPAIAFDEFSLTAEHLIYDTLVDYAPADAPDPLQIVPELAESWTLSPDRLTYDFTLRAGATFSDDEPVVAADFVHALTRVLTAGVGSPGAHFYAGIAGAQRVLDGAAAEVEGLRALDDRHLQVRLAAPDPSFLERLALPFATPQKAGRPTPLGTGPFVVAEWRAGERMVFARNPRYWDAELPRLDRIALELLVPSELATLKLLAGELDTADRLRADDYLRFAASPAWRPYLMRIPLMGTNAEGMNTSRPPFDRKEVRQAFSLALRRDDAVVLYNGRAEVADAVLPPGLPGHAPTPPPYVRDPARARALLAAAGYPDGLDVTYTTIPDEGLQLVAQSIQADLAEIGVRVRIETLTFPAYLTAVGRGDLGFFYTAWNMDFPDPSDFMDPLFHSAAIAPENATNVTRYATPELDRLLDAARGEPDPAARAELYRRAERLIHDDCPWIVHFYPRPVEVRRPRVMGYRPHPVWLRDYRRAWLGR